MDTSKTPTLRIIYVRKFFAKFFFSQKIYQTIFRLSFCLTKKNQKVKTSEYFVVKSAPQQASHRSASQEATMAYAQAKRLLLLLFSLTKYSKVGNNYTSVQPLCLLTYNKNSNYGYR